MTVLAVDGLFRAFGWVQMENHADLLLRLYGQARGRAAAYWSPSYVASDTTAHLFDFAGQARRWGKFSVSSAPCIFVASWPMQRGSRMRRLPSTVHSSSPPAAG